MTIARVASPSHRGWVRLAETNAELGVYTPNAAGTGSDCRLVFGNKTLAQHGADPNVVLFGNGNSTTRVQFATATHKFASFYTEGTATSGSSEGLYWRHYQSGAGAVTVGAGRLFATVQDVQVSNARGLHASLSFGTSGTVTGLGAAIEATLHIPNDASQAGTLYGIKSAIHSDGSTSDPAGATTLAYFAAVNQGDTTGDDDVDTDVVLFDIVNHAAGSNTLFHTNTNAVIDHSLKIKVDGVLYYIGLYDAIS